MWSSMKDGQLKASRTFVAGLAVNQRHPEAALEIMKGENMYTAMVHINLMAWSQTGDFKEIFNMLNAIIDRAKDKNNPKKLTTSTEVVRSIFQLQIIPIRNLKSKSHDFFSLFSSVHGNWKVRSTSRCARGDKSIS